MVFAAWKWKINWKYNFGIFPGWGICTPFLNPICRAFAAFPNQDDKYLTNAWGAGGWARLETIDQSIVENVILSGKLSILCGI